MGGRGELGGRVEMKRMGKQSGKGLNQAEGPSEAGVVKVETEVRRGW